MSLRDAAMAFPAASLARDLPSGHGLRDAHRPIAVLVRTLLVLSVAGCDVNGYPDLGEKLDVVVPCGASTTAWVRSTCGMNAQGTEDGHLITEVVTLGVASLDPTASEQGCFNLSHLHYDGSIRFRNGSFTTVGSTLRAQYGNLYDYTLQVDLGPLQRNGTFRIELSPPEQAQFEFEMSSDRTTLTLTDAADGTVRVYRNLLDVVASLDPSAEADAWILADIAALPQWHAFGRLLGYGAGGMTQYLDQPAEYLGAAQGRMIVEVSPPIINPLTTIEFDGWEEFAGIVLDGATYTRVDTAGNGESTGGWDFVLPIGVSASSTPYTGSIESTDVDVTKGIAGPGCLTFMLDGYPDRWLPSDVYGSIDLSGVLPTDGVPPGSPGPVCPNHAPWDRVECPRVP